MTLEQAKNFLRGSKIESFPAYPKGVDVHFEKDNTTLAFGYMYGGKASLVVLSEPESHFLDEDVRQLLTDNV